MDDLDLDLAFRDFKGDLVTVEVAEQLPKLWSLVLVVLLCHHHRFSIEVVDGPICLHLGVAGLWRIGTSIRWMFILNVLEESVASDAIHNVLYRAPKSVPREDGVDRFYSAAYEPEAEDDRTSSRIPGDVSLTFFERRGACFALRHA